jgi:hypothetical protein
MEGGGTADMIIQTIPELEAGYPDAHKFLKKGLPSYGFFLRHAQDITILDTEITPKYPDERPELYNGGDVSGVSYNNLIIK